MGMLSLKLISPKRVVEHLQGGVCVTTTSPSYFGDFSDRWQPTLNTVANYIAAARIDLNDTIPPYRYDDPSLILALNAILLEAARQRSDFFVFNLTYKGQIPSFQANDDTHVDIEPEFRMAIMHGMCGYAMKRDQEDYQDARVTTYFMLFNAGLTGKMLSGMAGGSGPGGEQR